MDLSRRVYGRVQAGDLWICLARSTELRVDLGRFGNGRLEEPTRFLTVPDIARRAAAPREKVEE